LGWVFPSSLFECVLGGDLGVKGDGGRRTTDDGTPSLREVTAAISSQLPESPKVAIVLGSGLSRLTEAVSGPVEIPYSSIAGFPQATVAGHAGRLVAGELEGVPVILQAGRFHLYEGYSADLVAFPIRVFAELGIPTLIVTNAAGGLRRSWRPPVLMLISDQINLMWQNPLLGPVVGSDERFPDMSEPYDTQLRKRARDVAREMGLVLEEGIYAGVLGPTYETASEIRMLQRLGADAVGMSTVPEVIAARARGMRVLGISTISNLGTGIAAEPLSHDEVLAASAVVAGDLERLIRGVLGGLAAA